VLFAISEGAKYSAVMTMVTMRCSSVPALLVVAVVAFRPRSARAQLGQRRPLADWRLVAVIITCGVFDVGANLLFGVASGRGSLAVVAVLGSLYPAGTVLLARFVDGERMTRVQNVGVVAALAGVAMIAVGS
jgi:drug/metabolite transporter (DMT)-like permease